MSITTRLDDTAWKRLVRRIERELKPAQLDKLLHKVAWGTQKRLVTTTRSKRGKGTGETSRGWKIIKIGFQQYEIVNTSKVALFLEQGTKAHGPKRGKFLYIPLRPGAAIWRKGLIFGKDYVLARRVKGIKAWKYLKPESLISKRDLRRRVLREFKKIRKGT